MRIYYGPRRTENLETVTWKLPLPAGLAPSQGHFDDHIPGTYNHEEARLQKCRSTSSLQTGCSRLHDTRLEGLAAAHIPPLRALGCLLHGPFAPAI